MFKSTKVKIQNHAFYNKFTIFAIPAIFVLLGGYIVVSSFAATPTAPAKANIWVTTSGSSTVGSGTNCQRSTSPIDYDSNKDCTWAAAYTAAQNGDAVNVVAGDYGSGNITFPATKSQSPTVNYFVTGGIAQVGDVFDVPTNTKLNGPVIASALDAGGASGVTVDGWEINGKFDVQQILNFVGSSGFTFRNGSVHGAYAANETGAMAIGGGSGITIENVDFYEAQLKPPNDGTHTECLYFTGASNVILRDSHFWSCSVMDVFITDWWGAGQNVKATNYLIENNIFEKPGGPNGNAFAFRTNDGERDAQGNLVIPPNVTPDPDGFIFRYNTFGPGAGMQWTTGSNPVTSNGFQLYGNYAPGGLAPCGKANVTCANNRTSTATGFVNAVVPNGDGIGQGVGHTDLKGDFSISNINSPLIDGGATSLPFPLLGSNCTVANPCFLNTNAPTAYPSTDKDGKNRFAGLAPDIGAYEYGVTSGGDTISPTVSITDPVGGGGSIGGTTGITASASDNVGVVGVQFKVDGVNIGSEDTSSPYRYDFWDTATVSNGSHTLTAVARDAAGNTTTSAGVVITVLNTDNTDPTVSISAPASNATVSGNVSVSGSASDNVGVVGVQFKVNGVNIGAEDLTSPYSVQWNSATSNSGKVTLTAVARDAAGNTVTSNPRTVTVTGGTADTTQPTVSITFPVGGTIGGTTGINASADDNVGVMGVQFKVDGANIGAEDTTAPFSYDFWNSASVANGNHSLTAVARDAAGNTKTSSAVSITVSNASSPKLPGDVDGNKVVDIDDLSLLLINWKKNYPQADFAKDNIIDIDDLSILLVNWGKKLEV